MFPKNCVVCATGVARQVWGRFASTATGSVPSCSRKLRPVSKMSGWQIHSYGALDEIQYSDSLKMPVLRSPNQVLVKVTASSVNPIDVAMISKCFLNFVGLVIDPFQLLFALVEMHFIPHCNCVMQVYEIFQCRDAHNLYN